MKIGILAYSLSVLENYWEKLNDKTDCWWGVTQQETFDELERMGMPNVVYCQDKYKLVSEKKGNKFVSVAPGKAEIEVVEKIDPDIWITDHTNRLTHAPKKCPWVQTFHSLCFKKYSFHPLTREYDLLLLSGEYYRKEFIKRLGFEENDERLKIVGWPRIDKLVKGEYNREEILSKLGLNMDRKTVLYAPTWGGYSKDMKSWGKYLFARWLDNETEIFERLCREIKELGLNFIVKTHQISMCSNSEELKRIAKKYDVLWVTPEMSNLQISPEPYLWVSDILISDMSGIIMDYICLDRPIIFIDPDEGLDAWNECSIPASYRAGEIVKTPEELVTAIKSSLDSPNKFQSMRQDIISKVFSSIDGNSSVRAADEILSFAKRKGLY
jgi:CDP-glycerol glycerophosphotransferase (TagB/SpsB family)